MDNIRHAPASWLPLPVAWFHILISLSEADRHGYGIMQEVSERTAGAVRLWPASLYGAIRHMVKDGLVTETAAPRKGDDQRRRYYRVTKLGQQVLAAEATRLEELARAARAVGTTRARRA